MKKYLLPLILVAACTVTPAGELSKAPASLTVAPTVTTQVFQNEDWPRFIAWAPIALEILNEHYEITEDVHLIIEARVGPMEGLMGLMRPGGGPEGQDLIVIFLRGYFRNTDQSQSELADTLVHEWLHFYDEVKGNPHPEGAHNEEFSKRIVAMKLLEKIKEGLKKRGLEHLSLPWPI